MLIIVDLIACTPAAVRTPPIFSDTIVKGNGYIYGETEPNVFVIVTDDVSIADTSTLEKVKKEIGCGVCVEVWIGTAWQIFVYPETLD